MTSFCKLSSGGSFLSVIGAVILLPLIEWGFRVETNMTFMDLGNTEHSLLKELSSKAPGTWAHCQEVAMVAENAALAVGANHLKVKVCALYHDVGKILSPDMFTENSDRPDGWTPVNDMQPEKAAETIKAHVNNGKNLIHYPHKSIKEAIASHHGTMPIGAFFLKAKQIYGDNVDEKKYRYPGPKPANKEEVILMLSDSMCAAVQSLPDKSSDKIENIASSVFLRQIEERQYDLANITIKELLTIYSTILDSLLVKNKKRISYSKVANN